MENRLFLACLTQRVQRLFSRRTCGNETAHVRRFHGAVRRDHAAVRHFCLTVQRFFVAPSPFHSCTFAVFSRQNLAIFALFKKKTKYRMIVSNGYYLSLCSFFISKRYFGIVLAAPICRGMKGRFLASLRSIRNESCIYFIICENPRYRRYQRSFETASRAFFAAESPSGDGGVKILFAW